MDDATFIRTERRRELGLFLRDRRSRVHPNDVGLPAGYGNRRVAGLRREEVAALAGIGIKWYTMLERGVAEGVSPKMLDAIARSLLLTDDETAYVHSLADTIIDEPPDAQIEPVVLRAFSAIEWAPAYICTAQWNVLAWNQAMSVVWGIEPPGGEPFNIVHRMFIDERMRALHGSAFDDFARRLVGMVRVGAGRLANDPVYLKMYATLHDDPVFATAWNAYAIAAPFGSAPTRIVSPNVGEFIYEALSLELAHGHSIVIQAPDAASATRLRAVLTKIEDAGEKL